jgi:signal transduction histidine kinase
MLRMNEVHLLQVLQNLIGNAIKYRKPNQSPEIWIWGECNSESAIIRIRDNGIGIPEEYRKQVFGLFRRLHSWDQYPGTGMGLAICQRLMERYGGKIWVDSWLGEGSEFAFSLPLKR